MDTHLSDLSMPQLVARYNELAAAAGARTVGPKAFNSRSTAVARIEALLAKVGEGAPEPRRPEPRAAAAIKFRTVREMAEHHLLQPISYKTILRMLLAYFPEAGTTVKCLRWYATQMRERGERVPTRPRHVSADEADAHPL